MGRSQKRKATEVTETGGKKRAPRGGTLIFCGYIGEAPASTPKPKKLPRFADHPKKIPVLSGIPKKKYMNF